MNKTTKQKCMICLEERTGDISSTADARSARSNAASCDHYACDDCFRTYLIYCENDRKQNAVCPDPDCKVVVAQATAMDILGRSYSPKVWLPATAAPYKDNNDAKSANDNHDTKKEPSPATTSKASGVESVNNDHTTKDQADESSLSEWLKANKAQQCENCSVWIVHEEGCEAMQCLCGYRFCWYCQMSAEECQCVWSPADFYDNILGFEGNSDVPKLASAEELQNFAEFYKGRLAELKDDSDDDNDDGNGDDDTTDTNDNSDNAAEEGVDQQTGYQYPIEEPVVAGVDAPAIDHKEAETKANGILNFSAIARPTATVLSRAQTC